MIFLILLILLILPFNAAAQGGIQSTQTTDRYVSPAGTYSGSFTHPACRWR